MNDLLTTTKHCSKQPHLLSPAICRLSG